MVMFSEDVTALDFDDDDDNEGGGRSGGDGDEVEVGDDDDDYASLYPSSPELGAGTSANFLRDQISFEDVLSPIADLLDPCDPDISEPDVVSVDDVDDEDDGSGGSGGLVGERSFSPAAGSDELLLGGGGGSGSLRRNRKRSKAAFQMHGEHADEEDLALGAALAAAAAATGGLGSSLKSHISKVVNGMNGSGHDSDGTYMSSLSGSGGGGGSVVVGRVGVGGVGSISDLLSPVEAAAERIERELSKDLFGDTDAFRAGENGSTPMAAADNRLENGLGLLNVVDPFDPLKWDTFSSVGGDPDDGGDRDQVMSPIRSPPHKELSPTGPLLSPHEPMRPNGGVVLLPPFVDHRGEDRRPRDVVVVGPIPIPPPPVQPLATADDDLEAEFDRPRPGMLFEHFEGPTAEKHPFLAADQLDHLHHPRHEVHRRSLADHSAHAQPAVAGATTATGVVRLTPSWEERPNLGEDQLNFRAISASMDRLDLEINPPADRFYLIYLTLVLHGIGTLMPWNMFITAKEYFVTYKLGADSPELGYYPWATYFLQYIGFAAQVPNVIFNWINVFFKVGGSLTSRIVWTLAIEIVIFVITIILAMIDSTTWPGIFFYLTILTVIILNTVNGIYQNTVYGLAAKLPFKYTGAVVLGSNLSGTIVAVINLISISLAPNPRTAAIYYFITALFVLLACFDTYFALPLNRFFRYHDHMYNQALQEKKLTKEQREQQQLQQQFGLLQDFETPPAIPYGSVFVKCFPQCFNVFFTFFVTLTIFPAIHAEIDQTDKNFAVPEKYFSAITCFLTFNLAAFVGNLLPAILKWPNPRTMFLPIVLRVVFIPFFALCNYQPSGMERLWPVLFHWDGVYWAGAILLGLTSGYFSSMAMMFCPRTVEPRYASTAGMFGAASIVTGIFSGIGLSYAMPALVSSPEYNFEEPAWWPHYNGEPLQWCCEETTADGSCAGDLTRC